MAHQLRLKLNTNLVAHKDLEIVVRQTSGKLGTLLISKGNIEWRPAWKSVKKHRFSWRKFAQLMENEGKQIRINR